MSGLFLLSSDSGSDEELKEIEKKTLSIEEQQQLEDRLKPTWKKVFSHINPELYAGTQEQLDGTVIKLIALSLEERDAGGRRLSILSPENTHQQSFKVFPLTIPQRVEQASQSKKEQPLKPEHKIDKGEKASEYPDSVWL